MTNSVILRGLLRLMPLYNPYVATIKHYVMNLRTWETLMLVCAFCFCALSGAWAQADLKPTFVSTPNAGRVGDLLSVQLSIQNNGNVEAPFSVWALRLSSDPVLSPDDLGLEAQFNAPVPAGQSVTVQANIRIALDYPRSGGHYLIAVADSKSAVSESDETNNLASRPFDVQLYLPPQNCQTDLGAVALLCTQTQPNNTLLAYKRTANGVEALQLDAQGKIINAQNSGPLAYDSVQVRNGKVIRKDPKGSILWERDIPANVLDRFPTIEAAAWLPNGQFVLSGYQKFFHPQGNVSQNRDSLVLVRTDANLNYLEYRLAAQNARQIDDDRVYAIKASSDGGILLAYNRMDDQIFETPMLSVAKFGSDLRPNTLDVLVGHRPHSITQTPCGQWLLRTAYQFASIKGLRYGNQDTWFDLETGRLLQRHVAGFGNLSQFGDYREYFFETLGQDSLYVGFTLLRDGPPIDSVSVFYRSSANAVPMRRNIPYVAFRQLVPFAGGTKLLALGQSDGKLWSYDLDCKPAAPVADLELTLTAAPNDPSLWTYANLFLTLKNTGNLAAQNIRVDFMDQSNPQVWSRLAYVSSSAPAGTAFNDWLGRWNVPILLPGERKILTYRIFTKVGGDIPVFAQVAQSTTPDVDAVAGNDFNQTPNEDDETLLVLKVGPIATDHGVEARAADTTATTCQLAISPNPAANRILVQIQGDWHGQATLTLMDVWGRVLLDQKGDGNTAGKWVLDLSNIPAGRYSLLVSNEAGQTISRLVSVYK